MNLLKTEKFISLQQKMKNTLDPLWSLAVDKHNTLTEKVNNRLQEKSDGTVVQALTNLKNKSDEKFKEIEALHQEYQLKMPVDKLLSESFDKKQKETNLRLREIMLEMYNFSEQQEKQLKKITV